MFVHALLSSCYPFACLCCLSSNKGNVFYRGVGEAMHSVLQKPSHIQFWPNTWTLCNAATFDMGVANPGHGEFMCMRYGLTFLFACFRSVPTQTCVVAACTLAAYDFSKICAEHRHIQRQRKHVVCRYDFGHDIHYGLDMWLS